MKIDTLRVLNFRCFEEDIYGEWGVTFRPNRDLNLIIGPNGSGKTAILDALDTVMNVEGRTNQSLISEYDFPYCDTTKIICIEVTLVDFGRALGEFEWDIQWSDPKDGMPIEAKNIDLDGEKNTSKYEDIPGFCKSIETEEIKDHGHVLTPGRYVGAEEIKDDGIPFEEKMGELSATLYQQFDKADQLEATIKKNLEALGYGG